jgi:hypothetical protein|tara:strand:+ start:91 stop:531 length:441 start_codon:yes stop_codon:yes gene_type:complete
VHLLHERGAVVKRGETLGFFERNQIPVVDVFVTEQEARSIHLDQLAQVHLLSLDERWLGYVSDIKTDTLASPSSGYNYRPDIATTRTVKVEVRLELSGSGRLNLRSGLPVEVRFATSTISRAVLKHFSKREPQKIVEQSVPSQQRL